MLVNCSSVKPDKPHDNACYIEQGEHEFIKHRSYIVYKQARIETLEKIERGISTGRFIKKEIIKWRALQANFKRGLLLAYTLKGDIPALLNQQLLNDITNL